ncbi:MAG TPA: lipocalin family protein [Usitatibacteraceae bacterium]|jgi:apolipoprotein D and lipocalin family protein|nr:lipocalin family protein [Usitatibacteraceae bacterium]HQY46741.1 lipocalin family protein [Usitatibacteraceae bacterium]HRA22731.1 lipocalin family protein [Usitatibacteraceae bacterium]
MTKTLAVHLVAFLACLPALSLAEPPPVRTVAAVDLARYAGKWYEIAAFPMFFQRQCLGDTTAEYGVRDDGDLSVVNRCRTEDGFDEATARAWAVEGGGNAKLKVSFFWPFRADYWVIGLDDGYRWAVVGNPERRYLWILSRTPRLPAPLLEQALAAARAQGYDLSQLRYTPQRENGAIPGRTP